MARVNGQIVELRDCFWVRYEPSGCASGSLLGEFAATPEQAHQEFTSRKRDREREIRRGYRHELVDRDEWDATVKACLLGKCQHRQTTKGGAADAR